MTLTIRSKVLLLSLTLLSIPYVGYQYVREMEAYLRDNLETSLQDTARALASVLNDRPALFNRRLVDTVKEGTELVAHSFKTPIQLDGKADDWDIYLERAEDYADKHILKRYGHYSPQSLSFKHILGKYRNHLYVLFIVKDDKIVYRTPKSMELDRNDHLQIVMQEPNQQFYRYIVTPTGEGWVSAYKVPTGGRITAPQTEIRIQGTWKQNKDGYTLELRIPLTMVGDRLGFAIADVDDRRTRIIKAVIGTSAIHNLDTVGKVFIPIPEIEKTIRSLGDDPGRRLWVLDRQHRVLAQTGDLRREFPYHPLNMLYSFLLPPASEDFKDDQARASRLEGEEVTLALDGESAIRWRPTSDEQAVIVSAAHPVFAGEEVMGAVVVEETSNSIQAIQRQAISKLFNKTLLIFSLVTLLLLLFATRLSVRLRRLRNQAERAIDPHGRVTTTAITTNADDEIGDLSHSFSVILIKLKQYNTYLEGMASKLSHELRTPLAVVRSSLENLEQESLPSDAGIYIERAKEGVTRLNTIITRLSEATKLEQALQTTETEKEFFDFNELTSSCVAGYRLAYPTQRFQAQLTPMPVFIEGAPDLIAQMLDKLVSNAVDFCEDGAPIEIQLYQEKNRVCLKVINRGTPIPANMQERLFESMVSLRKQVPAKKEPHLGLGLYMVRLIVGYHRGQVQAENCSDFPGAIFTIWLPVRVSEVGVN